MTRSLSNDTTTTVQGSTVVGGGGGGGGLEIISSGTGNALTVQGNVVATGNVVAQYFYGSGQFLTGITGGGGGGGTVSSELVVANVIYGSNVLSVGNVLSGNGAAFFANGLGLYGNAVTGMIRVTPTQGLRVVQNDFAGALLEKRVNDSSLDRYGLSTDAAGTVRVHGSSAGSGSTGPKVALAFATGETTFQDGLVVLRHVVGGTTLANVGINTAAPEEALHVVGNVRVAGHLVASGDVTAFSDATLKTELSRVEDAMTKVQGLTGYTYQRTDMTSSRRFAGLLAQDVRAVLPEASHQLEDGTLTVSYGSLSALFVECLKELQHRVSALEQR